jgi:hypothetical protein
LLGQAALSAFFKLFWATALMEKAQNAIKSVALEKEKSGFTGFPKSFSSVIGTVLKASRFRSGTCVWRGAHPLCRPGICFNA